MKISFVLLQLSAAGVAEAFTVVVQRQQSSSLRMDRSNWAGNQENNDYNIEQSYRQSFAEPPTYYNENNYGPPQSYNNNDGFQNFQEEYNYNYKNVADYNNNDGAFYTSSQEQTPYNGFTQRPVSYYEPQQYNHNNFPPEAERPSVPEYYGRQQQQMAPQHALPGQQMHQEVTQPTDTVSNEFELNDDEPVIIQGGSLRTYSFNEGVERSQLYLATEGRPLNGVLELWCGPDNTPQKCKFYTEDGYARPIRLFVETPKARSDNTAVCIKNTGSLEFPVSAWIDPNIDSIAVYGQQTTVQGGAIHTFPFDSTVSAVQMLLETDGRPLQARIELMQGPNNSKQLMEVYTEDGQTRPFFTILETPGNNNVVRLINTGSIEFPLHAVVEPYAMEEYNENTGGWDEDYHHGSASGVNKGWSDPAEKMIQDYQSSSSNMYGNDGNNNQGTTEKSDQSGFYQRL